MKAKPDHRGIKVLWWALAWIGPLSRAFANLTTMFVRDGDALPAFYAWTSEGRSLIA